MQDNEVFWMITFGGIIGCFIYHLKLGGDPFEYLLLIFGLGFIFFIMNFLFHKEFIKGRNKIETI